MFALERYATGHPIERPARFGLPMPLKPAFDGVACTGFGIPVHKAA